MMEKKSMKAIQKQSNGSSSKKLMSIDQIVMGMGQVHVFINFHQSIRDLQIKIYECGNLQRFHPEWKNTDISRTTFL